MRLGLQHGPQNRPRLSLGNIRTGPTLLSGSGYGFNSSIKLGPNPPFQSTVAVRHLMLLGTRLTYDTIFSRGHSVRPPLYSKIHSICRPLLKLARCWIFPAKIALISNALFLINRVAPYRTLGTSLYYTLSIDSALEPGLDVRTRLSSKRCTIGGLMNVISGSVKKKEHQFFRLNDLDLPTRSLIAELWVRTDT